MTIASSLINAGGAVRALTSGPGVLLANRATRFLLWSNLVADGVSALLIAAEGVQQIAAIIDNDAMRPEQQRAAVLRIITNLIMTGALLAVSAGQLREHRTRMETNFGKAVAAKLGDEVAMTLSMLDDMTLQGLKTAGDQDLGKLAGALRHEPALMNTLKTESRLARALPLMKTATPDELRIAVMRATAHEAGVSVANSERLALVLVEAGVPSTVAMTARPELLKRFADPAVLGELEAVVKLEKSGRIKGLDDWIAFGAKKSGDDLENVTFELREARRQATNNPSSVVNVGSDARAPKRPDGEAMKSFDQTIETPRRKVETSIEVTTIEDALKNDRDLSPGVKHGIDKVKSRNADGVRAHVQLQHRAHVDLQRNPASRSCFSTCSR